jgi:2-keto-4-pentenoate hydratase/2-oxohepta-3-ene-1,7-dioic acid hydratase in catechol pathway
MKLVTFSVEGTVKCGLLKDDAIVEIPGFDDMVDILSKGRRYLSEILDKCEKTWLPADVKILSPILNPGKLIGLAGNYAKHIKEAGLKLGLSESPEKTTVPRPFLMPNTSLCSPKEQIPWPSYSKELDHEIELAVVIGKTASCISAGDAPEHIAGYTIVNDISARSVTFKKARAQRPWDEFFDWLGGKWADGFLPLGPWLVTADEVGNANDLDMELKVNGVVRQKSNTSEMIFSAAKVVSFLSHIMTLNPGDIIATGTPAGVGMAEGRFLAPGDIIECRIEKLGCLKNTIGANPGGFYEPLVQ